MIKYLIKYIKSVKNFISSKSDEEYRFGDYKYNEYFQYYNVNKSYYKEYFEIYNYEYLNKVIRIRFSNHILGKLYSLYLPISFRLLIDNL